MWGGGIALPPYSPSSLYWEDLGRNVRKVVYVCVCVGGIALPPYSPSSLYWEDLGRNVRKVVYVCMCVWGGGGGVEIIFFPLSLIVFASC